MFEISRIKDSNNVPISASLTPAHVPPGGNTRGCVALESVCNSRPIEGEETQVTLAINGCEEKNKLIYVINTQNSLQRFQMRRL